MSKLDDLINKLCPDGVEYKRIDTVAYLHYGKGNNIPKDGGIYPVYGCKGIVSSTSTYNCENQPLVGHIGSAGEVTWGEGKIYVTYNATICESNPDIILAKYLYHILCCLGLKNYVKGSQPFLSTSDFGCVEIPVPPLEVQNEIVHILDKFTSLEAELEAELEARRKQYEYYRDSLLTFCDNVEWKTLGELCSLYAGATPSTSKPEYWENGTIPWMSSGEVNLGQVFSTEKKITQLGYDKCSTKMVPPNSVVIALAGQGKTRGTVAITRIPLCTNQSLCSLIPDDSLDSYYLYFYMKGQYNELRRISSGDGTRGGLNLKMISEFKIPVPSIETQKKVTAILDRFESLCNDITSGLPAEIEARHKQYEYYRDKLLTFKRKDA